MAVDGTEWSLTSRSMNEGGMAGLPGKEKRGAGGRGLGVYLDGSETREQHIPCLSEGGEQLLRLHLLRHSFQHQHSDGVAHPRVEYSIGLYNSRENIGSITHSFRPL